MNKLKSNKAFTIVELIVVIAIIAILVLLGAPKIQGYVDKAKLARIQHDVRVMENEAEAFSLNGEDWAISNDWTTNYDSWDAHEKDLNNLVMQEKLYEEKGIAKDVEYSRRFLSLKAEALARETSTFSTNTDDATVGENLKGSGYKIIPKELVKNINTRLPGTFYVNHDKKVYYEHDKPLKVDNPIKSQCIAPKPLPDYVFDKDTGTIVKYKGNAQHLTIPGVFNVDGECYPVLIIGKGAFMQGKYKKIIVPEGVDIEDGAFENVEVDDIVIPSHITNPDKIFSSGSQESTIVSKPVYSGSGSSKPGSSGTIIIGGSGSSGSGSGGSGSGGSGSNSSSAVGSFDYVITGGSGGGPGTGGTSGTGGGIVIDRYNPPNNNTNTVYIPPKVIVDGEEIPVVAVDKGAFQGKGLITVIMPEGLKRIEDYAFAGNQLIGVNIPNSVEHIGNYAFSFNELEKISGPGPDTIPTIKTIVIKDIEQFDKVNKYGDIIYGDGKKADILKGIGSDVVLKNHIWVTSTDNIVIEDEYIEGMKPGDRSALQNKLEEVKGLKEEDYVSGWGELQNAVAQANKVINKSKAREAEIAIAIENLDKAIAQLTKKPTSPGPSSPIEGATDGEYTFYGEVSTSELISGNELATKVFGDKPPGTENKDKINGESYSTEPWLKFTKEVDKDGNKTSKVTTMYIAKKTYRHSITWDNINAVGAVFGKEVTINGQKYKVRLLKGANQDPVTNTTGPQFHNSEWNKIMLPIHEEAINKNWAYPQLVRNGGVANDPTVEFKHALGTGPNKRYTDADLLTHQTHGNGSFSWTQERQESYGPNRVIRGGHGVSDRNGSTSSGSTTIRGWRPVLELIGD